MCCGIKVLSVAIFLIDWWLIRQRQNAEKKQSALTVGEVVNSIISLDKRELPFQNIKLKNIHNFISLKYSFSVFEPDGALWVKMSDAEEAAAPGKAANTGAAAEAASLR